MLIPCMLVATLLTNEPLLQKASTLDTTGIVYQQGSYAYLKITDDYIHELYTFLDTTHPISKPDYFSTTKSAGAHITIAYPEENMLLSPEDLGQSHTFLIENVSHVILGNKGYFVLVVSAPSLEQLREKYGLPKTPYYKGKQIVFHITIASYLL